jgi:hypothetical protein
MAAPMVPGITIKPARLMSRRKRATPSRGSSTTWLVWIEGYPYELTGEDAHVLKFFQRLQARRSARVGRLHDQAILPDAIRRGSNQPRHDHPAAWDKTTRSGSATASAT